MTVGLPGPKSCLDSQTHGWGSDPTIPDRASHVMAAGPVLNSNAGRFGWERLEKWTGWSARLVISSFRFEGIAPAGCKWSIRISH
jgi:hypothetical protein